MKPRRAKVRELEQFFLTDCGGRSLDSLNDRLETARQLLARFDIYITELDMEDEDDGR